MMQRIAVGGLALLTISVLLILTGCQQPDLVPPPEPPPPDVSAPVPADAPPAVQLPAPTRPRAVDRRQASSALTQAAVDQLARKQWAAAIRTLERAVSVDPSDGEAYFHLATAWLAKGDAGRARQFHRQAQLYLGVSPHWQQRLADQQRAIEAAGTVAQ